MIHCGQWWAVRVRNGRGLCWVGRVVRVNRVTVRMQFDWGSRLVPRRWLLGTVIPLEPK